MPHVIEQAKSGRASCKGCSESIAKDTLRLGEEVPNPFSDGQMSFKWYHLQCGAKKKPSALRQALESTDIDIPEKPRLLEIIKESAREEKPTVCPYAEESPSGRAACAQCSEKIEKGAMRIAVQSDFEVGAFARKKYLHPACALDHTGESAEELMEKIRTNSINLYDSELEAVESEIYG